MFECLLLRGFIVRSIDPAPVSLALSLNQTDPKIQMVFNHLRYILLKKYYIQRDTMRERDILIIIILLIIIIIKLHHVFSHSAAH